MKRVLGLDLGTTSIGWAYVLESNIADSTYRILDGGVRVNPLTTDEAKNFPEGKPITTTAGRTLKRSMRRNLQRFKLRREGLLEQLYELGFIEKDTILSENGKGSTYEILKLRALAAEEEISLRDFARVLLTINKKRGYRSSRKLKGDEEGVAVDDMELAKVLATRKISPGAYVLELLEKGKALIPIFYKSDLEAEFEKVYSIQSQYHSEIMTSEFKEAITNKGYSDTLKQFRNKYSIDSPKFNGKRLKKLSATYRLRASAIEMKLNKEEVALVLAEINKNIAASSGYLGAIGDRSKTLYFNDLTVGQYQLKQVLADRHRPIKGQIFYRQDYLDEFNSIWNVQRSLSGNIELFSEENQKKIRDIIFYQRRLKSQKHLVSYCEFEPQRKVIPRSSPMFQYFKIWQNIKNVRILSKENRREEFSLSQEQERLLFEELWIVGNITKASALRILNLSSRKYDLNYTALNGNTTNKALVDAYFTMLENEGNDIDNKKLSAEDVSQILIDFFSSIGVDISILEFDPRILGNSFDKQSSYQLWHLLYSYEGDNSKSGNDALLLQLKNKFGFTKQQAKILANVSMEQDYGSLSTRAIRKIIQHLQDVPYDEACALAGYNHSNYKTKELNLDRLLLTQLPLIKKNTLRNPVVEKILNQLVNLVNAILVDSGLGPPDEIRIELARELKKSVKERQNATTAITKATKVNDQIRELLRNEFRIQNPTRNDIIRYKLYLELEKNGHRTLYSNQYISRDMIFTPQVEIEHIIPQSRVFDDSFSNKTLSTHKENQQKGNDTAWDYISAHGEDAERTYNARVEMMYSEGVISRSKYRKLLMKGNEINEGFIERDLKDSQYIAKYAKNMLLDVSRTVTSTSGRITDKLRNDWGLINVLKELNLEKYRKAGLTEVIALRNGRSKESIKSWSKRNDHRHHAMDALVVAFTRPAYIQYLNNLNAKSDSSQSIKGIMDKWTEKDSTGKRRFVPPLKDMRTQAQDFLQGILISHKAKNKVVTRNINCTKKKGTIKYNIKIQLTPRGQLHKESVYGRRQKYGVNYEKVGSKFTSEKIATVAKTSHRKALLNRLDMYEGNPQKAFTGKNSLVKKPIFLDKQGIKKFPEKVKTVVPVDEYVIRKEVNVDLTAKHIEKVIDKGIREKLKERLKEYGGKPKLAFANLDENPIWQNKEKGIAIKRVRIKGVNNVEALHVKRNHNGDIMQDSDGEVIATTFVSTGNNHHVAVYHNSKGKYQAVVISFMKAVALASQGLSVIDRDFNKELGWEFLFTMKQNEMFVFPSDSFDPTEIDLMDVRNKHLISPRLFRVQKIAERNYHFRHHLETEVEDTKTLRNITWIQMRSNKFDKMVKVRINHRGNIVHVGEY